MTGFFSIVSVLKSVFLFLCNLKRVFRLLVVPVLIGCFLMLIGYFFPIFSLAETAKVSFDINYAVFFASAAVLLFLALSLMMKVQKIIFFGENENNQKVFIPLPDKNFFKYLLSFLNLMAGSLIFAALCAFLLVVILKSILKISEVPNLYILLGALFLLPYFMIRFSMLLPAAAADKRVTVFRSWGMTQEAGLFVTMYYAASALFPLLVVAAVYPLVTFWMPDNFLAMLFLNVAAICSLFLSCISQGAFMGYLFAVLDDRN